MTGMTSRCRVLIGLCIAAVHGGTVHADMMPVSSWGISPLVRTNAATSRSGADSSSSCGDPLRVDLELSPTKWPLEALDRKSVV